jgi:hypothetical protein
VRGAPDPTAGGAGGLAGATVIDWPLFTGAPPACSCSTWSISGSILRSAIVQRQAQRLAGIVVADRDVGVAGRLDAAEAESPCRRPSRCALNSAKCATATLPVVGSTRRRSTPQSVVIFTSRWL